MRLLLPLALLALASCATTATEVHEQATARQARADSAARANWHAPAAPLPPRKVRGNYTVIYQVAGPGAVVTGSADNNEKAGQKQGSQASGPGCTAGNESKRTAGGTPWLVYLLVAAIGAAAWEWLSSKLPLGWLRWRARPGPQVG